MYSIVLGNTKRLLRIIWNKPLSIRYILERNFVAALFCIQTKQKPLSKEIHFF